MNFIDIYVEELDKKRVILMELFGKREPSFLEKTLRELLESHWHPLPHPEKVFEREFAVDSSSASRSINNGLELVIVRALMIGGGKPEAKKMIFEPMRSVQDPYTIRDLERTLRDLVEIEIILDNWDDIDGSIILIDGNLYGRYTHLNKQYDLKNWEYLPLRLFDSMQRIFKICSEKKVTLVGVSKFSRTRVFCNALLSQEAPQSQDPEFLDVELLYKAKTEETGYTTPLLLGTYAFREEVESMSRSPERYFNRYFNKVPKERREWAIDVIRGIPEAPATVMFHIIPEAGEQPLRVDIPANCLGLKHRMGDMDISPFTFLDSDLVKDIVRQLLSDRGGRDVYNALLYVVDKEVKLSPDVVDNVYRSILGREVGVPIEYDRSSRRFYS
jgi:hypothetical protein